LLWTIGYDPRCRFEFKVDSRAAEQLEEAQLSSLLQIAREAMSNSLRHAQARTVLVALQPNHDTIQFEVRDDGVGFDAAAVGASGFGLRNISARAQELGARLEVHSRPGQGTRILLKLPRNHEPRADSN
jgi:signal transduction histidine kinase